MEVNCTTDGKMNFANVTWKLKALENESRADIISRVENCVMKYRCGNVSSNYYTVLYCTAGLLLAISSPLCSKVYQIITNL